MSANNSALNWREAIFNRRMLICIFVGFSSGLPLYIVLQMMPAWLRTEGVGLKEIGFFTLAQFPYTWKFLWAPLLDRYQLPFLGRRRGWMLVTQIGLLLSVASVGWFSPSSQLATISMLAVIVAAFSATQDIVLDAYRRELLPDNELGLGNSIHVQAYRISGLVPAAFAFILADHLPWSWVFVIVAGFMLIGIGLTLAIKELPIKGEPPKTLKQAVIEPFKDFFSRNSISGAITVLAFMVMYKFGDNMATALSTPFYIDLGFTLTEIGVIAKNAALWPAIIGGMMGGVLMLRIGINKGLWVFGFVQVVTILGFAALAEVGANKWMLALVVSMEYLGVGLGTAAFTAFIARTANPLFAATQLALFTALASLPRTVVNAFTGIMVEHLGWFDFYLLCALTAIPGMLLLFKVAPWGADKDNAMGPTEKS
jgi:PAT family beta-lactamase induction signal transducer AmpG